VHCTNRIPLATHACGDRCEDLVVQLLTHTRADRATHQFFTR
jgi:hypothetical protein